MVKLYRGAAWAVLAMVVLAGCDLSQVVDVPSTPVAKKIPGSSAAILANSDWADAKVGSIASDSGDWFRLRLHRDSSYSVSVSGLYFAANGGTTDVRVEIYTDTAGPAWTTAGVVGGETTARVVFRSPVEGLVRVHVVSLSSSGRGAYEAMVRAEDKYESDATPGTAPALVVDATASWRLISQPDTDWVKVNTTAGKYYEIRSNSSVIKLAVFDAGMGAVSASRRFDPAGYGVIWGFYAPGNAVYARVAMHPDSSREGVYSLWAHQVADDRWEPDDSSSMAGSVAMGETQNRVLIPYTSDWIQFATRADKAYHVQVLSDLDLSYTVVDSVGRQHGIGSSASAGVTFVSSFAVPVFVKVFGAASVAPYSIKVTESDTVLPPPDTIDPDLPIL